MFVSVGVRLVGGYMAVTCFVRSRGAKENGEGEAGERGGGVGWGGVCVRVFLVFVSSLLALVILSSFVRIVVL